MQPAGLDGAAKQSCGFNGPDNRKGPFLQVCINEERHLSI